MNITKTNMLLMNNKIMKEDAGSNTTTVDAPVPSTEPEAGMKALSFLGMKNLMENPYLAKETGFMRDVNSEKTNSNIAFQGKFDKAGRKFAQYFPAGLIATSTVLPGMLALQSCEKEWKVSQNVNVEVDVQAVVDAINALRQDMSSRDKELMAKLEAAIAELEVLRAEVKNQTLSIEEFKRLVLGELVDGKLQRSAILEAIIQLQNTTEQAAWDAVNRILEAYEKGQITFQEAMAKIQNLLKENNNLLESILKQLQDASKKAAQYAESLLSVANQINANGKATVEQQNVLIAQNDALIEQNNIKIAQGELMLQKADEINMSIEDLTLVAQLMGVSIENVLKMSKDQIIAAIKKQVLDLKETNEKLDAINNGIANNTMTVEGAANAIIKLLGNIDTNVSEIKDMLKNHFKKYDEDMAELKAAKKDIQKFAKVAISAAADIRNMAADVNTIKLNLQNGTLSDLSSIQELLEKIEANQQMSRDQIVTRMDAYLAKIKTLADKLDGTNERLEALKFVLSNDVINAINNLGDDLEGIAELNDKMDELIAAVKVLVKTFDIYAKNAMTAYNEHTDLLTNIDNTIQGWKGNYTNIEADLQELIKQGNKAEVQRKSMENSLESLLKQVDKIEAKMGRIPTIEEFYAMLTAHDEANQAFYANLIKSSGLNPADFTDIKDLLKAIKDSVDDFQKTTNGYLADILARMKAMDPSAPDYNDKLDKIIDLMKNFKFECNCKCDCDNNQTVHEGIIDIIG